MKIGILGDTQFTNKVPQRRVDDYFQTQIGKLDQSLTIFEENKCACIVQPGDFFDSPKVANRVKASIISLLNFYFVHPMVDFDTIHCCWGQHDVIGHSKFTLPNSPLAVLEAAEVVKILGSEPVVVGRVSTDDDTRVCLYGAGFGEDVPEPYEDCFNVLVAHKMVGDRPLWPGQELIGPRNFLREHSGFNLCVLGDYHYRFVETWNGRTIVNVGALVRRTNSKFDLEHTPAVGVFDTDSGDLQIIKLTIKPADEVFDLTEKVKKRDNPILMELVKRLKEGESKLVGWKSILSRVFEEKRSMKEVREIIDETLEEVERK